MNTKGRSETSASATTRANGGLSKSSTATPCAAPLGIGAAAKTFRDHAKRQAPPASAKPTPAREAICERVRRAASEALTLRIATRPGRVPWLPRRTAEAREDV